MFEYQKQKEREKINQLEQELAEKYQEGSNYAQEKNSIDSCWNLIESINERKREMVVLTLVGSFLIFSFLSPSLVMVGVFLYIADIYETISILKTKKKIKRTYGELYNYSKKELEEKWWDLYTKQWNNSRTQAAINTKINHCKRRLEQLEQDTNKILESSQKVLLSASNEKEYQFLKQKQEEQLNLFNNFLEKKVEYSNIHFDNSIGENIEYTENSKKLLKKI